MNLQKIFEEAVNTLFSLVEIMIMVMIGYEMASVSYIIDKQVFLDFSMAYSLDEHLLFFELLCFTYVAITVINHSDRIIAMINSLIMGLRIKKATSMKK